VISLAPMSELSDRELASVIELERRLLDPAVRRDRVALAELLHQEFREFGVSGRVFDRATIIDELLVEAEGMARAWDFRAVRLGPDAALLTYRTDRPSLRASVWVRGGGGAWRLLHHQGTPGAREPA
jgi:hypothetical protein